MPTATSPSPFPRSGTEDVRGCRVIGADGADLGEVDDLIVDPGRGTAFLWVVGADEAPIVIPVGLVGRRVGPAVHLAAPGETVTAVGRYDPCVPEAEFLDRLTSHFAA